MAKTVADLTILVVDDARSIRESMASLLRHFGVGTVLEAADGLEAIRHFEAPDRSIDGMFCDLAMPGMDGVETLRRLAEMQVETAVSIMSALDRRLAFAVSDMARRSGLRVLGTLPKPIDSDTVQVAIDEILAAAPRGRHIEFRAPQPISAEDLDQALNERRIEVYYQPKIRLEDGKLVGVEALARLRHPVRGLLAPACFIQLAEELGGRQIVRLTQQVFRHAIDEASIWNRLGLDIGIAINMSVLALRNLDVPEVVAAYVDRAGLPRERVTFEITESRVYGGSEILDILARLRLLRFNLSIDDFGTGESGIQRLKRLPFTELKIDRSFVNGAAADEDLRAILSTSIELGRRLRMKVVAEGVESADDWRLLEELGCDQIQGYLASRPLPGASIVKFAKQWNLRTQLEKPSIRATVAR